MILHYCVSKYEVNNRCSISCVIVWSRMIWQLDRAQISTVVMSRLYSLVISDLKAEVVGLRPVYGVLVGHVGSMGPEEWLFGQVVLFMLFWRRQCVCHNFEMLWTEIDRFQPRVFLRLIFNLPKVEDKIDDVLVMIFLGFVGDFSESWRGVLERHVPWFMCQCTMSWVELGAQPLLDLFRSWVASFT